MMALAWTVERLKAKSAPAIQSLYRRAKGQDTNEAKALVAMIIENGLLVDEKGGLPFDHPIMLEIEAICQEDSAINEGLAAAEAGLPPLAGMEYRLVKALGENYGGHYTTHHAGRCIGTAMLDRGWKQAGMKPMPKGSVAKTATVYVRKSAG